MIGALLQLLRRVPVRSADGLLVGRELARRHGRPDRHGAGGAAAGAAAERPSARASSATTRRVHAVDGAVGALAGRAGGPARPAGAADAVCVQLTYFSRYQGLLGERFLPHCKPDQVLVSLAHSSAVRRSGAGRGAGQRPHGRGLVRQRGAGHARSRAGRCTACDTCRSRRAWPSTTRESRVRSAWAVARRIDELLARAERRAPATFRPTAARRAALISKPVQRRAEVRRAAARSCATTAAGARATKLSLPSLASALAISPSRRAISLARRSRSAADVDLDLQRQPRIALHRHRRGARGLREAASSATTCTSDSLASAFSSGAACGDEAGVAAGQQRHALGR